VAPSKYRMRQLDQLNKFLSIATMQYYVFDQLPDMTVLCDVCRQLPMISALLQGRAQYNFGEVKSRNYLLLYTHLLGILELLQPFVFEPAHRMAFQNLMQAYFELIMVGILNSNSFALEMYTVNVTNVAYILYERVSDYILYML